MAIGNDFVESLQKVRVLQKSRTRSVNELIKDFQSGKIVIPSYQRTFVWDLHKQCRFIESIFMDVPIPFIFLLEKFDEEKDERLLEVIDGVQRLTTLGYFKNGTLKLTNLITLPDLNQSTYPSLPQKISSLFLERQINTIVIETGTQPEIQFEVFGRLNQGSVSLNPQELRNCMFHGEFNDFLIDCSHSTLYKELLLPFPKFKQAKEGKPDPNRMLDVELILRFFAFYELYKPESNQYPEARSETLNDYMRLRIPNAGKKLLQEVNLRANEELESLFKKVLHMVKLTFNEKQFRNFSVKTDKAQFSQPLNQAIFDVQMQGFVDYTIIDIQNKTEIIYEAFLDICSYDRNFIDAVSLRTDSKLNERIGIWKNKLSQVIENSQSYYEKLEMKRQVFNSNPICSSSGKRIETIDEADFVDGMLYHRCSSPSLTQTELQPRKRTTVTSPIKFYLNGSPHESDNILEAIYMILEFVVERIKEDEYSINRLASLSFVGTYMELSDKSNRELKKFKALGIENSNFKQLYIDVSGGRTENVQNVTEIASLFSFMSEFKFVE
jgi:uncharacterized protein with ParB-like and HNH nuclease domain